MALELRGNDSMLQSTPARLFRGGRTVLRRTVYLANRDTATEFKLDLSAANGVTEIVWRLLTTLEKDATATLTKRLSAGGISRVTDGTDGLIDIVVDDSDTASLDAGMYWGQLTVTKSGQPVKMQPYRISLEAAAT